MKRPSLGLVFCLLLPACKASVEAAASVDVVGSSGSGQEKGREPLGAAEEQVIAGEGASASLVTVTPPKAPESGALLGARHDLKFSGGGRSVECGCVKATLGQARDPSFSWLGDPPKTDPNHQLTLAFTSEGVACQGEPEGSLGASYWGFRWQGEDLIVLLEPAVLGRPMTTGAILPRPRAGGSVFLAPVSNELPYGKALTGGGEPCKLGNPGAPNGRP